MAQQINDTFQLLAGLPIDDRIRKSTIAERDGIPSTRRFQGLQCFVQQTQTLYLLRGGILNSNWVGISGANASSSLETVVEGFYVLSAGKETLLDWEVGDKFRGWIDDRYVVGEILSLPVSLPSDIDDASKVYLAIDSDNINVLDDEFVYKKTIAEIRAYSGVLPSNNFYTTDLGKEGNWYYDTSDTTSADNTGTVLVTSDGKRIKRILKDYVSIEWFGAVGDNTTDNVTAINNTIAFVYANPNYKIFIPGKQFFTSPIVLPARATTEPGFATIEIVGVNKADQFFGTQNDMATGVSGSILRTSSTTSPLIHCNANATGYLFSFIKLVIKDLTLRTYQNPQISALSAGNAVQLVVEDVQIDTNKYSVTTAEPTHTTATGLITPYNDNGALTVLRNVAISGYYNGIEVNEHTDADAINLTCNKVALLFKTANHSSHFTRVDAQRNVVVTKFTGSHTTKIEELNMEFRDPASPFEDPAHAWQNTTYDIDDPINYGKGLIYWANVKGYAGAFNKFVKNGGVNVQTYSLREGSETFNAIKTGTIESSILLDIGGTDLNSLDRQGDFRGITLTNAPDTGFWYITNLIFDSSFKKQTATAMGAGNTYPAGTILERVKVSGTWSSWEVSYKGALNSLESGSYTPTVTNVSNVTGIVNIDGIYTKIGNIVTVRVSFASANTSSSTASKVTITLPFNRANTTNYTIGSGSQVHGTNSANYASCVATSTATTTTELSWFPVSVNLGSVSVSFQYDVTK